MNREIPEIKNVHAESLVLRYRPQVLYVLENLLTGENNVL
jgi:hypothetical protein